MKINTNSNFVKTAELENGIRAKITTEATWVTTDFKYEDGNPKQALQAKVKFEGVADEKTVSFNKVTREGLIKAFGDDTADWIGRLLRVEKQRANVGGKNVWVLYLIPAGFVLGEDSESRNVIVPADKAMAPVSKPAEDTSDVPFEDEKTEEEIPF